MAILVAIISKISNLLSSYVQTNGTSSVTSLAIENPYSMPYLYFFVLAVVAAVGYFLWQSYRQEIHEEKLQQKADLKEEDYSSYNLTWVNKLINWGYLTGSNRIPPVVERWIEDVNINLAKNQGPLKVLVYGLCEGSMPPFLRQVGQFKKLGEHIELPVLLESPEFGFMISVQEEENGRVHASTYNVIVDKFKCWYTTILSRVDGKLLAKLELCRDKPKTASFYLKSLSDQKVLSTVPEVVADAVKASVMDTPFYINLSTWEPVFPLTPSKVASTEQADLHKDSNGNTVLNKTAKYSAKEDKKGIKISANQSEASHNEIFQPMHKSSTMPLDRASVDATTQGSNLGGSLGSLIGIKRTPSGRGPAKPIRSREKQLVMKVMKINGLQATGPIFCKATLDNPAQKCKTKPVEAGSNTSWPDEELIFDLSFRSSEVKLVIYRISPEEADSPVASAVLSLEKVNMEQPSEYTLPLKTLHRETASVTLQLTFSENPVESSLVRSEAAKTRARRSLDISLIADQLPRLVGNKDNFEDKSTVSSASCDDVSCAASTQNQTTVTMTTTRKVSPLRNSSQPDLPQINIESNKESVQSDVAKVDGSVAEIAVNDLSKQAKIAEESPELKNRIKKGKVVITAISKTTIGEDIPDSAIQPIVKNQDESPKVFKVEKEKPTEEMYYSVSSLSTHGSEKPNTEENIGNLESEKPVKKEPTQLSPKGASNQTRYRRKRGRRPKSMVAGIRDDDLPKNVPENEWPKVRRSRSLIFGRGKKKNFKTGSTTDLHKHENPREEAYHGGYEEESMLSVPENDLQKSKKKKSKSISKLFSKLGRKTSMRKSKRDSAAFDDTLAPPSGEESSLRMDMSANNVSISETSHLDERDSRMDMNSPGLSTDTESLASHNPSPSASHNSSFGNDKGDLKRSKSLRKRLFGGKRKLNKN